MTALLGACATGSSTASSGGGGGGGSSGSVSITDQEIFENQIGTATATYIIDNDGRVKDGNSAILESWLISGTNSSYEVRATVVSGTLTSGSTGSWLSCASDASWSLVNSLQNNSVKTCVLTIEIRLASTGVVQDSATVTLFAESDNNL